MALERLDDVPWHALHDAYGTADPIPDKLRALRHRRAGERRAALDGLRMALCPEGVTVSEASAHAVPFLVGLAASHEVRDRGAIMALLQSMAEAVCDDGEPRAPSERAAPLHAATRSALLRSVEAFQALLVDPEAEVRARAALICAALGSADDSLRMPLGRALVDALAREPAVDARVAHVHALAQLGALDALRTALAERAFPVRLAAALALIRHDPPDSPAFAIVRDALRKLGASEARYGAAARYRPLDWIADLSAAGARAEPLLTELLLLLRDSVPARVHIDLTPVLAAFFPHGAPDVPTAAQSAIAKTVASNRAYFGREAGVRSCLRAHGLPDRIQPLRRYAERGPSGYTRLLPPSPPARSARAIFQQALAGRAPDAVRDIDLVGVASEQVLAMLPALPQLGQLLVKSATVGAAGFASIAAVPALAYLELEDLTLSRASAAALAESRSLHSLTLIDVALEPGALKELGTRSALTFLCLRGTSVAAPEFTALEKSALRTLFIEDVGTLDAALVQQLATLPRLEHLHLASVDATPDALAALGELTSLHTLALLGRPLSALPPLPAQLAALSLVGSAVSAAALDALAQYGALRRLDLVGVALGDAHVEALSRCVNLRELRASMDSLDDAAAAHLRQRLPHLSLMRV